MKTYTHKEKSFEFAQAIRANCLGSFVTADKWLHSFTVNHHEKTITVSCQKWEKDKAIEKAPFHGKKYSFESSSYEHDAEIHREAYEFGALNIAVK